MGRGLLFQCLYQDALDAAHVDEVDVQGPLAGGVQALGGVTLAQTQQLVSMPNPGPKDPSEFARCAARRPSRTPEHPSLNRRCNTRPSFKKKNRTGTGSFLATSGVTPIKYDGHRRIKLPYLGSVKLKRELPEGIPYEVRISRQNGR